MDKQTLIALAQKVGIDPAELLLPEMSPANGGKIEPRLSTDLNERGRLLLELVGLAVAQEREACAKACDAVADEEARRHSSRMTERDGGRAAADCAKSIRSRNCRIGGFSEFVKPENGKPISARNEFTFHAAPEWSRGED